MQLALNEEEKRLKAHREGREDWRLWGPYLAERAWGTVREDYSQNGEAWEYFTHDHARSRAYRWNEDGMGGICDEQQRLCFALALWNEKDPILKERAFGLTGNQGNHGEDVKEYYFYKDATPSHSHMRYLYKYPQTAFPYNSLVEENARRSRQDPPFNLLDTDAFKDNRYFDVEICYAKAGSEETHIRIVVTNRGAETAKIHLLPTLWFRNTWSWGDVSAKPMLTEKAAPQDSQWAVEVQHETLGQYFLYGKEQSETLFTENESNKEKLWGSPNASHYVKDAFHRYVIDKEADAINSSKSGTKFAAAYIFEIPSGASSTINLVLTAKALKMPFEKSSHVFADRENEANVFYEAILPKATLEDQNITRQALAGMIWSKQFFHYDVARWLDGDQIQPPDGHKFGRNKNWRHLKAAHVISMSDAWEFPWFAAWDLAYHTAALALVDIDFAKDQVELLLLESYLHPNGQIPAYEWSFDDLNPPVLAMAALKVFRADRVNHGKADMHFLQRVSDKLMINYTWWLNNEEVDGESIFGGGFLGFDNISVYDRSHPLPSGFSLKQADATGWMAMYSLNMTVMALELATEKDDYESVAMQCYSQFLSIANLIAGHSHNSISLWDPNDGFFKDLIVDANGIEQRIDVFSWVGIIPIFACEVIDARLLKNVPRFAALLAKHVGGALDGHSISACPHTPNDRGEHLLSLLDHSKLQPILQHLLSEDEFLSKHGIRSLSKIHSQRQDLGYLQGVGEELIEYVPGESNSGLFGGNSNWRGPIWMPTNYSLIQALEKYHRYLGNDFKVKVPCLNNAELTLQDVAKLISERLVNLFRRNETGRIPAMPENSPFQYETYWKDLLLFNEYFHGETGLGLGSMHQTGWTGLVANLVARHYREDVPEFWKHSIERANRHLD